MEKQLKIINVFVDKAPVSVSPINEEITSESNLQLNPTIKNHNFFEDDEVVEFVLNATNKNKK